MRWFLLATATLMTSSAIADPILDNSYPRMSLEQIGFPSLWPKEDEDARHDGFTPMDIVDIKLDGIKNQGMKVAARGYLIILADGFAALSNRRDGSNPIYVDFTRASRMLRSNILNECSDRSITCIMQVRGTLVEIAAQPGSVFINAE